MVVVLNFVCIQHFYKRKNVIKIDNRNDLLKLLPTGMAVAELGVFKSEFSDLLIDTLKPSIIYLVDIFDGDMCSGDKDGNNIVYINFKDLYPVIINKYKDVDFVKVIKSDSHSFLKSVKDSSLDMVYIDADHSYAAVAEDLRLSRMKVRKHGFICGHDYSSDKFPGVFKAVNEFCNNYSLSIKYITEDGCPTYIIENT